MLPVGDFVQSEPGKQGVVNRGCPQGSEKEQPSRTGKDEDSWRRQGDASGGHWFNIWDQKNGQVSSQGTGLPSVLRSVVPWERASREAPGTRQRKGSVAQSVRATDSEAGRRSRAFLFAGCHDKGGKGIRSQSSPSSPEAVKRVGADA